jgi:hypothetical protein
MTLSSLGQISKYLEEHESSQRIKKLIFFTCKNVWENDQDALDRVQLKELIEELSSLNPTIDHLTSRLSITVENLSKPREYTIIAGIIIKEIGRLYLTCDQPTEIISTPSNQNIPVVDSSKQRLSNPATTTPISSKKFQYNQFDLRQNLMRYANPLRVKIILFSALYGKFTFNEKDWLQLREEDLDSLLQLLFDSCSTIVELESRINNAVISLDNPDKNSPAATAIIRVMRGLYNEISVKNN